MKASIYDVAKTAGVSVVTVSRVINNAPTVRQTSRDKVMKAIKELNYQPSSAAQSLARGKTNVIGLLIPNLTDPFIMEVVDAVDRALEKKGYFLALSVIGGHENDSDVRSNFLFQHDRVDGVLILTPIFEEEYVTSLKDKDIPFVIMDNQIFPYTVSSIKPTFTTNPDGSFTFSNGIDPDVNFNPTVPGNTPIVSNSDSGIGNCTQFGLNETRDLIIQGAYFDGASTVLIPGQTINNVTINSTSQITANITTGGTYGNFDISVTNNAGVGTQSGGFILQASPVLNTYAYSIAEMTLTGSMTYDGNSLSKTATAGWNAQGYSTKHAISPTTGGYLDWTGNQSNQYLMVGLSSNPDASSSYTNLDYAIYMVSNSRIQIRENGASLGYVDSYAAGDQFRINVDCLGNVTYLRNGNVIFNSSKKATNNLYFDTSHHTVGATISNISITY